MDSSTEPYRQMACITLVEAIIQSGKQVNVRFSDITKKKIERLVQKTVEKAFKESYAIVGDEHASKQTYTKEFIDALTQIARDAR